MLCFAAHLKHQPCYFSSSKVRMLCFEEEKDNTTLSSQLDNLMVNNFTQNSSFVDLIWFELISFKTTLVLCKINVLKLKVLLLRANLFAICCWLVKLFIPLHYDLNLISFFLFFLSWFLISCSGDWLVVNHAAARANNP